MIVLYSFAINYSCIMALAIASKAATPLIATCYAYFSEELDKKGSSVDRVKTKSFQFKVFVLTLAGAGLLQLGMGHFKQTVNVTAVTILFEIMNSNDTRETCRWMIPVAAGALAYFNW